MSESDYDSATEYTSLMDGHAEVRTEGLGSGVENRKRKRLAKAASNTEVSFYLAHTIFFSFNQYLIKFN